VLEVKNPSTLLVPSPKLKLTSKKGEPARFKLNATASGANPEAALAEQVAVRLELGDVPLSSQPTSSTSSAKPAVAASRGKGFIVLEGIRSNRRSRSSLEAVVHVYDEINRARGIVLLCDRSSGAAPTAGSPVMPLC
jgi:hypothetical protein